MTSRRISSYRRADSKRAFLARKYAVALTNAPEMAALMAVTMENARSYMAARRREAKVSRGRGEEGAGRGRERCRERCICKCECKCTATAADVVRHWADMGKHLCSGTT
jgi:hypothetical protein